MIEIKIGMDVLTSSGRGWKLVGLVPLEARDVGCIFLVRVDPMYRTIRVGEIFTTSVPPLRITQTQVAEAEAVAANHKQQRDNIMKSKTTEVNEIPNNKTQEVKAYRTTDGELFDTKKDADERQLYLDMREWDLSNAIDVVRTKGRLKDVFDRAIGSQDYLKALKAFVKRMK